MHEWLPKIQVQYFHIPLPAKENYIEIQRVSLN